MYQVFFKISLVFWALFLNMKASFAAEGGGFGSVAENAIEPMGVVVGFISVGCLIIGFSCVFAGVVKYFEHKRSPLAVPFSTVVWLFIIGLLLLCLPFAYMVTDSGIPVSALWGGD